MAAAKVDATTQTALKHTLFVGMASLDIVHVCTQFPSENVDNNCLLAYWQRGGRASNSSTVMSRLGGKCELLGMMSTMAEYKFLRDDCTQYDISTEHCPTTDKAPPFSTVVLNTAAGTSTVTTTETGFPPVTIDHFRTVELRDYHWVHFEVCDIQETTQMMRDVLQHNDRGVSEQIFLSVSLATIKEEVLPLALMADYVFIDKDACREQGWENRKDACYCMRRMLLELGKKEGIDTQPVLLIRWSRYGAAVMDRQDMYLEVPRPPVRQVLDSLGAPDVFVGAAIYALLVLEIKLRDAAYFGNLCAGYKLTFRGYDNIENFVFYLKTAKTKKELK